MRKIIIAAALSVGKLLVVLLVISGLGAGVQYLRLHELGPRPGGATESDDLSAGVKFVEANGLRFGYIEVGSGPLVLLLHGYPETARSWRAVQDQLDENGFRSVAVFMRGYAPTAFGEDYSVRSLGQDAVSLIEALGEDSAIVVGHDWGATAAYEAAFIAPEMVSHLVTLSIPHPRGTQPNLELLRRAPHFLYYQLPTAERLIWSDDFGHIRRIYSAWSPGFKMPEWEFADIRKTMEMPGVIAATLGYYRAIFFNGADNAELGPDDDIIVPTLVIAGDNDGAVVIDGFNQAEGAFTGGYAFELLENTGHFAHIERPLAVAELITQFVAAN